MAPEGEDAAAAGSSPRRTEAVRSGRAGASTLTRLVVESERRRESVRAGPPARMLSDLGSKDDKGGD